MRHIKMIKRSNFPKSVETSLCKVKKELLRVNKSMSKGMVRNYRRYEEQKQLKIENIRLLKRLQNSNPTYNYNEYEMENKKKKRLLNRI